MVELSTELELLKSIDTKLGVLVALTLDDYVRSHGIAGAKPRKIEAMLLDAQLSSAEAATLLGKTQRAVTKALEPGKKAAKKKAPAKKAAARKRR